jgi:hypothetical protein
VFQRLLATLVPAAAIALVYWDAATSYFFEDDFSWLVSRWSFHPGDLFDLASRSHFYRPLVELYFWFGLRVFDGSPIAFHLSSIVIHAVNGGLVYLMARSIGMAGLYAWFAMILFVVQPAYVDAVAWVGAIAETIGATFGITAILSFVRFRRTCRVRWHALSAVAFALALLTHESSVVFLLLIAFTDVMTGHVVWRVRPLLSSYSPLVVITILYLAVDLTVNARHYLIAEGQYRFGLHMVTNVFQYIASLYVGERTMAAHTLVAVVIGIILTRGTVIARLAIGWTVIAMLPFLPFTFANVSRYSYLPAVGLAILLAEGLSALDQWLARRTVHRRRVIVGTAAFALAVRFGLFAVEGTADFAARANTYRDFLARLRETHPTLEDAAVVPIDRATEARLPHRYVEPAIQWEYGNPTIRVVVVPTDKSSELEGERTR